jgi:hypothetical protein
MQAETNRKIIFMAILIQMLSDVVRDRIAGTHCRSLIHFRLILSYLGLRDNACKQKIKIKLGGQECPTQLKLSCELVSNYGSNYEKTNLPQIISRRRGSGRRWRSACLRFSSENEDHAGTSLPAAKSESAVQPERRSGHRRD